MDFSKFAKNIPANARILIRGWLAGVTLDDGQVERWITAEELSEIGDYSFRVIRPDSLGNTSACHTIRLYQDNNYLG
ncbi:MAG: hypothetical protein ACRC37_04575, partial [Lentisphaeria bacterium]